MEERNQNLPAGQGSPAPFIPTGTPPKRVRRIGTVTLGLSLVAAGVLLLITIFEPSFDIFEAARWSPLILVFIGAELLISPFIFKDAQIKYDFLSILICFLLIVFSFGLRLIPFFYENVVLREEMEERTLYQIESQVYNLGEKNVSMADANGSFFLDLQDGLSAEEDPETLYDDFSWIDLTVELSGTFETADDFIAAARRLLARLDTLPLPDYCTLTIYGLTPEGRQCLELNSRSQWDCTEKQLAEYCYCYPAGDLFDD